MTSSSIRISTTLRTSSVLPEYLLRKVVGLPEQLAHTVGNALVVLTGRQFHAMLVIDRHLERPILAVHGEIIRHTTRQGRRTLQVIARPRRLDAQNILVDISSGDKAPRVSG